MLQPLIVQSSLVSVPLHYESIFIARTSFSFFSTLECVVQFSRSLCGYHSTPLHYTSANTLSPLNQVTVYVRPQHIRYFTVSRSRLHRYSVLLQSELDRDPTVYFKFSMLGRIMIYSNVYNILFNRLKAFLDCSVFTIHHSNNYKMFQNFFTQCIELFTYLQSNSNEYPPSENKTRHLPNLCYRTIKKSNKSTKSCAPSKQSKNRKQSKKHIYNHR